MTRRWGTLGLVTIAAVAAAASPSGAQQAPAAPRARVWVGCDDCSDDSLAVLRAKRELERVTAAHEELTRAMAEAHASPEEQQGARREMLRLQSQMMQLSRQLTAARPRGWIGLTFEGPQESHFEDGKMISTFPEYPVIVAVDANSPADRAGVQRGDSLLAMNGKDLRRGVALADLLQPERKVSLRLRRESRVKEVTVSVAKAPASVVQRRMDFVEVGPVFARTPRTPRAPVAPMAPMPPLPPGVREMDPAMIERVEITRGQNPGGVSETRIFVFPRTDGLAGADMRTVDADLAESFGISRGVFVVSTAASSLAREAGLRGGDVIITADGRDVNTVGELRTLVAKTNASGSRGERAMRLEVQRAGGKKRSLVLRW